MSKGHKGHKPTPSRAVSSVKGKVGGTRYDLARKTFVTDYFVSSNDILDFYTNLQGPLDSEEVESFPSSTGTTIPLFLVLCRNNLRDGTGSFSSNTVLYHKVVRLT